MTEFDEKFMHEAIRWAGKCDPIKESIPRVGAIIAVNGEVLGRGRRGTGMQGDDEHAEWNAFDNVRDKDRLPGATIYTTLEPCTPFVRTKPLECCTEQILQHEIRKVFIGILDPNEGVTGKGILQLQQAGVEVELFQHELAKQIRAINAPFIRSQKTLGATILSPEEGETLKTYDTQGKCTVRFKCLNPPDTSNYLLVMRQGLCWPQSRLFRQFDGPIWDVDAHFGTPGEHTLHIVTANDLGCTAIEYYRKVVNLNRERRERLKNIPETKTILDNNPSLLGGDYPGIQMNGLPKGLRSEASVRVIIEKKP